MSSSWIVCVVVAAVVIGQIHGASVDKDNKTDKKVDLTKNETFIEKNETPTLPTHHEQNKTTAHILPKGETVLHRAVRQLGYGNQYGSLGSALQGISSGYGYGYNNAVGLGGQGVGGAGAGYLPLIFGRR